MISCKLGNKHGGDGGVENGFLVSRESSRYLMFAKADRQSKQKQKSCVPL